MTLKDRLTKEQLALIDLDSQKYTYINKGLIDALESNTYVIDLKFYYVVRLCSIMGVTTNEVFNLFKVEIH